MGRQYSLKKELNKSDEQFGKAPNATAHKRWSCHSGLKLLCKLCRTSSPTAMGARFTVFWACRPCGTAGWLALLLIKAGDVETNPSPTTLNKKVWICDICHKQIHARKQISIRCNRIEHWVHLRCAGIRQAQYTDTWTCHLHKESRLTPHTDLTPPHRSRPLSKPPTNSPPTPPTPPQPKHRHMSNTPPVPRGLVKPKPNSLIHSPPSPPTMYRLFKKQLNFEDYLLSCNNRERISLTKYRCANSKIPVYNQIYMYETKLCTLCDLNVNGDEYHYIMICPYFRQSRELYLKHYFYTRPNMRKFSQLFSSENKRTLSRLAKLITVIMIQF